MIISDNPFLIETAIGVQTENPTPSEWIFRVSENGVLTADFLQTNADLKVTVYLSGKQAKSQINCGYLVNKNNKINIDIKVIHNTAETSSDQVVRGLVTDQGAVNFNGTITIPYDSQKCDGKQNHRAVILSDRATVSATPQLEIWADDVKCAHGSAIGPLDPQQLFYLQTRGISESDAKKLLLSSFFTGVLSEEFDSCIQDWMEHNV